MTKSESTSEDKWIDCKNYVVEIDLENKSFAMELNKGLTTNAHVLTANATPELVRQILNVLAATWPKKNIQFQVGEKHRLTKIQAVIKTGADASRTGN